MFQTEHLGHRLGKKKLAMWLFYKRYDLSHFYTAGLKRNRSVKRVALHRALLRSNVDNLYSLKMKGKEKFSSLEWLSSVCLTAVPFFRTFSSSSEMNPNFSTKMFLSQAKKFDLLTR